MKRSYFIFVPLLVIGLTNLANAQGSEGEVPLKLLQAPASPAFVLLGVEPESVERPGEPTDLGFSMLSATENLSVLPQDYAMSIAPYWIFGGGRQLTFDNWSSGGGAWQTILQTLDLSMATTSREVELDGGGKQLNTSLGLGLRMSIVRGEVDESASEGLKELKAMQLAAAKKSVVRINELQALSPHLIALETEIYDSNTSKTRRASLEKEIAVLNNQIAKQAENEIVQDFEKLKVAASKVRLRRVGFKLDLAGGVTGDFPDRQTREGALERSGAWLTGGYEDDRVSGLLVARWLSTNNRDAPNSSSYDLGMRIIFDDMKRFSLSIEGLGRWYDDNAVLEDTWRASLIGAYQVSPNRTLSFTFGRDFEGKQSGNVLAVVQLLMGFGSDRGSFN